MAAAFWVFHPPFCCLHPKRYEIAPTHPYTWSVAHWILAYDFGGLPQQQVPTPVPESPEAKGPRKGRWYVWGFVRQRWGTSNFSYAILKYPNMDWNQRFHIFGPVELWLVNQKGNQEHTTAGIWTYWTHKVKQTKIGSFESPKIVVYMGLSENVGYIPNYSHLIGIMISKTIG
jgi:hypothetical protein